MEFSVPLLEVFPSLANAGNALFMPPDQKLMLHLITGDPNLLIPSVISVP
jgi:hypothetical protein